jgi:DNA mismatch repair protein MSH4
MKERSGVINLHLAVDMSEQTKMTMLYKIAEGFSKEERYGLALARVVGLPPLVLEIATDVSNYLQDCAAAKKRSSKASALAKRRKLVLGLRETLLQAQDGPMEGKVLLIWMRKLQMEFVKRMDLIEKEAEGSGDEETEVDGEEKSQVKTGPEVDWTSSVEDESQIGRDLEIEDHSNAEEESQVGPQYFY